MNAPKTELPVSLVERPDGSFVNLEKLPPREKLGHELVVQQFPKALALSSEIEQLKQATLREMEAYRDLMFEEFDVTVTGSEGGFSLKSVCGTMRVEMSIAKHISFGEELIVAKELLDQFLEQELETSSEAIREIVTGAFKLNSKGRLNRDGILGLRKHRFESDLWVRAMAAIKKAIREDHQTTYLRFYRIDTDKNQEEMVVLDMAKA